MKSQLTSPARSRRARHLAVLAAGTALTAAGLAAATLPASAAARLTAAHRATARSNTPKTPGFEGRLYGGTAISATDAWAVGLNSVGSLILHWNGTAWQKSLNSTGFLHGAGASSADDVWAVGGSDWFGSQPMIMHWDGKTWTRMNAPVFTAGGLLSSVTATSPHDAWAVGQIGNGAGDGINAADRTLVLHWDGTSWTQVPSPTPAPGGGLASVSAVSPTDAWAIGWHGAGAPGTSRTLAEHWDGTAWTVVGTPFSKPGIRTQMYDILALSKDNVWAVGATRVDRRTRTYILHWDGDHWVRFASPTKAPGTVLYGVGGTSASNIWAVGQTSDCPRVRCAIAIEHWNGKKWMLVPAPNPKSGTLNALFTVMPTGTRNAWAVGTTDYARTLIQRWNGKSWSGPN